jgi:acetyltransferase
MLEKFFNPKSVAVIGASSDPKKVGFALVSNLLNGKKREIYPVTLSEKEVLNIPAFTGVLDIQGEIDLAVIAVRADIVPQVLIECGKKQVSNAIIISSGFKETGLVGKELEDNVANIAKEYGITLLGPNCLGIVDTKNDFNASFSVQKPLSGNIALLSQSGALGTAMLDWAAFEGVGFSKFISLGNEAELTEIDFLKYLKNDSNTGSILIYLEKVNNGGEFMRLLSETTKKKPVVILKAGVSARGIKAVMSHTGSLAPEARVFASACKQAGAIIVPSLRKFFNISKLLSLGVNVNTPIQRLLVLTNGGGPSVIAADEIDLSNSLSLIELDENIKEALRKVLPKMAAVDNPIDIIGDALAERYEKALEILCEIKEADSIIVMLTPQMMTEAEATACLLAKYKEKKKIFPVFIGGSSVQSGRAALIQSGLVNFSFSKDVVYGLDSLANGAPKPLLSKTAFEMPQLQKAVLDSTSQISFADTSKLLSDYGMSISGNFVAKKEDLAGALSSCGEGPYAMKAISSSIVHKTDVGAVKLNISNLEEANATWDEMGNKFGQIEGMLVQKMAAGKEVIIGMKKDITFGPTILFGLGGIFAEAIKDTTLRVASVEKNEALKMMQEIKGIKILQGMRGEKSVDFDLLADIILNLSRLALEHPEIKEIDLNPVMATENSTTIVDARVMI